MSAYLSILAPIQITDAMLVSSTASEPATSGEPAWAAITSYAVDSLVSRSTTHRIYRNLIAGVDATLPEDSALLTTPHWQDIGPTNQRAMFDGEVSTQTVVASPLTVVIRPGFFNSLYLAGLDAAGATITVKDAPGGNVIYSAVGPLEGSAPDDYYEWCFDPFKPQRDLLLSGIDPYNAAEITVTLTGGTVKCGMMALGDLRPLGSTQYGAKAKPKSYSYIDIDKYGNNKIVRRKKAKDISATAMLSLSEANSVLETITELLDVPCVVICTDLPEYGGLRAFGLVSGELSYDFPKDCQLSVNVLGLI
ncbi:hypothetical protein [Herminiimonas sp. CN]|uniref:hypothetical protein n=1 Tax=Herminiimonas sp. CN TaxID=1349818 RepID=UPI0004730EF8|nr:hypothetical protein [Herminiimonas sp. CN]